MRDLTVSTACALAIAAVSAGALEAQSLGSGDYELCSVYRPDGSFAGYSNACLERQRASIRRNSQHSNSQHRGGHYRTPPPGAPVYSGYASAATLCPSWANNGYGYSSTLVSSGFGSNIQYGTFNSTVNGQPCISNPVIFRRGFN